jgi:hypothetical protein
VYIFEWFVESVSMNSRAKQMEGNLLTHVPPSPNRALNMWSPTQAALFIGEVQPDCAHQF